MKHSFKYKIISLILAFSIILTSVSGMSIYADNLNDTTISNMEYQLSQLEYKEQELKKRLAELESEKETSVKYQETLEEEIKVIEKQILMSAQSINALDENIILLENELKESQKKIENTFELLKTRIKAIYKMGSVGTLQILFDAESLDDYMRRSQLMENMTAHDKALMEEINGYMDETREKRELQKKQKNEVANLKISLEVKSEELKNLEKENKALIELLTEKEIITKNEIEEIHADSEALSSMMEDYIRQMILAEANKPKPTPSPTPTPTPTPTPAPSIEPSIEPTAEPSVKPTETASPTIVPTPTPIPTPSPTPTPGISLQWPCPGYVYISAEWDGYPGHKGLDMAANFGTPIYAAESGTIMMANKTDEWGYSWGYYVSIYHNSTYSTLYAHCSSIVVDTGDWVEKGQLIAYVGSTGNSEGNHLHFEVYENGTRVNPRKFF